MVIGSTVSRPVARQNIKGARKERKTDGERHKEGEKGIRDKTCP
jgi:hypothetical protein